MRRKEDLLHKYMDWLILCADILHVDGHDLRADLLVELHTRGSDDVGQFQGRIDGESLCIEGGRGEVVSTGFRIFRKDTETAGSSEPLIINFFHPLYNLKQAGTA